MNRDCTGSGGAGEGDGARATLHAPRHRVQAEKKRVDRLNKGMAERTIDAQRVSGESLSGCGNGRRLVASGSLTCRSPLPSHRLGPPAATVPRDTVQLYQQLRESGLQYGPAFRCCPAARCPLPHYPLPRPRCCSPHFVSDPCRCRECRLLRNVHVPDVASA